MPAKFSYRFNAMPNCVERACKIESPENNWFVYMIEDDKGAYYTGVSTDVERRFEEHSSGKRGARYFHGRTPKAVVYVEDGHDRSSAHKREAQIKKLNRKSKQELVRRGPDSS